MKSLFYLLIVVLCLGMTSLSSAQDQADNQEDAVSEGGVLMLQEILIEVAPELPTVVVTIQRQRPEIEKVTIKSPLKRMQFEETTLIRPDLSKMKPTKIKEPKKMLARERKH